MDYDDKKREAAISSVIDASLKPKLLNPSSSVTQSRISKFQELHNRRMQIKEKSKLKKKKKSKGRSSGPSRSREKDSETEECASECKTAQGTSTSISLDGQQDNVLSMTKDVAPRIVSKKPQKLYWGLDTKERWERKSNM